MDQSQRKMENSQSNCNIELHQSQCRGGVWTGPRVTSLLRGWHQDPRFYSTQQRKMICASYLSYRPYISGQIYRLNRNEAIPIIKADSVYHHRPDRTGSTNITYLFTVIITCLISLFVKNAPQTFSALRNCSFCHCLAPALDEIKCIWHGCVYFWISLVYRYIVLWNKMFNIFEYRNAWKGALKLKSEIGKLE